MEQKKKDKFSFDRFTKKKKDKLPQHASSKDINKLKEQRLPKRSVSEKGEDPDGEENEKKGPSIDNEYTMKGGNLTLWAETMNDEQITECKLAFSQFDKSKEGKVGWKDFGKLLRHMGQNPTEIELEDIRVNRILQSGGNGTFSIDFPEFITMIAKRMGSDGLDEIERAFRAFDENGDGLISFEEFRSYNEKIGQFLSDEEISDIIKEVDLDGDGFLNYEEFVKMNMR